MPPAIATLAKPVQSGFMAPVSSSSIKTTISSASVRCSMISTLSGANSRTPNLYQAPIVSRAKSFHEPNCFRNQILSGTKSQARLVFVGNDRKHVVKARCIEHFIDRGLQSEYGKTAMARFGALGGSQNAT